MASRHPWPMPEDEDGRHVPLVKLCSLVGDTLKICVPLSPTQNVWDRWPWRKREQYKGACATLVVWQVNRCITGAPWAQKVRISMVRCSSAYVAADPTNLWSGLKGPIDSAVRSGVIPDDGPDHVELGSAEDRRRGHWGEYQGPGTYLIFERLEER